MNYFTKCVKTVLGYLKMLRLAFAVIRLLRNHAHANEHNFTAQNIDPVALWVLVVPPHGHDFV